MAKREDLRRTRTGTVINLDSNKMESELGKALEQAISALEEEFPTLTFIHEKQVFLHEIVKDLKRDFPDSTFACHFKTSFLKPDGGILYLADVSGGRHVVLVSEAKRQGTNDIRAQEGLPKQSKGNAIERLGKNMTGVRAWLASEAIMPFVCFGEGVDFASDSSILDRVSTLAMFAPLNTYEVVPPADFAFPRGNFFFRVEKWTPGEMSDRLVEVARRSVYHYFSKHGRDHFQRQQSNEGSPGAQV